MIIRTSLLMQSLMIGMWPADNTNTNQMEYFDLRMRNTDFQKPSLTPIPDAKDIAKMARFIVHQANWTSVAYISHQKGSEGRALGDMFSVSDGPVEAGNGVPYLYVSRLEAAISDLLDNNNQCSLTMGLAETTLCKERDWDDEDPRCAHVVMTGTFHRLDTKSPEWKSAQIALFSRHPSFRTLPPGHHFFVAKFAIDTISLQDTFGGPVFVPVDEYFGVKDGFFGLDSLFGPRPIDDYYYDMNNEIEVKKSVVVI